MTNVQFGGILTPLYRLKHKGKGNTTSANVYTRCNCSGVVGPKPTGGGGGDEIQTLVFFCAHAQCAFAFDIDID